MKHIIKFRDITDGIGLMVKDDRLRSVTVFCSPLKDVKARVRVTRRGKNSLIVTYGGPNWNEREFLKLCRKAKTLPRRIRLTYAKAGR